MSDPAATTLWARAVAEELVRAGVRDIVVAPGSRSTPLVLACAAQEGLRCRVHLDERSAAFFALGAGRASGRPAALITTSGTAVANLFPAVIEASQAGVPLLILTADRPPRLRDADANQAIDQVRIFGHYPRLFLEPGLPRMDGPSLRHLRTTVDRAVAATVAPDPGPVHVNFPFEKPLEPVAPPADFVADHPVAAAGRADGSPLVRITPARRVAPDSVLDDLATEVRDRRGVVVAGPSAGAEHAGRAAVQLAAELGWPLLADPLSGARYGPSEGAAVVAAYDLFLRDPEIRARLAPDAIVRVGASPTSAALQTWMEEQNGTYHLVVDAGGRWKDHGAIATRYVQADAGDTLLRLAERCRRGGGRSDTVERWGEVWRDMDSAARQALADMAPGDGDEGRVVAEVLGAVPADSTLFVSSSMPVRDLDAFGLPREEVVHVHANRGASGIDGIVSTAFGVASQGAAPTVCILGDLAFFHDRNGLLWAREPDCPVIFVLVDNDGGGIFHMLPVAEHEPHFTRFFATPHGLDPRHAAAAHDVDFLEVGVADLGTALTQVLLGARTTVLRVRTDREANRALRLAARDAVVGSVRSVLG